MRPIIVQVGLHWYVIELTPTEVAGGTLAVIVSGPHDTLLGVIDALEARKLLDTD